PHAAGLCRNLQRQRGGGAGGDDPDATGLRDQLQGDPDLRPEAGKDLAAINRLAFLRQFVAAGSSAAALLLGGCGTVGPQKVEIEMPTSGRTAAMQSAPAPQANGAIFQVGSYRGFFEDRKARHLGDTLTVQIEEKMSARQSSTSSLDRKGSVDASIAALPFTGKHALSKLGVNGSSGNTFEGKGSTLSDNTFVGTITVTVVEVLPNGNLVVAGEK